VRRTGDAYREGVTADDEFRKVAEDLRGLARSLRAEIKAAKWEARAAARDARRNWRWDAWQGDWARPPSPPPRWWEPQTGAPGAPGAGTTGPATTAGGPGQGTAETGATWQGGGAGQTGTTGQAGVTGAGVSGAGVSGATADVGAATGTATPGAGAQAAGAGAQAPPGPGPAPWGWGPPWAGRPWPWGPYHHTPGRTVVAAPPVAKPAPPPPPPVRHRRDGSTLISLLLVLVGLAWLGSASGVVSLSLETVLASVLVVLGAAMVVTARTDWSLSRRHWPVWLGIAVLVLVIASSGQGGLSRLHFGPITETPSASELSTPVTNVAGPITVTLPTSAPARDVTLRVHDVFGPVSVVVPRDVQYAVHIEAHTRFGPVDLPGVNDGNGMFSHKTATIKHAGPTVTVDASDVFGPINVTQQ